jgi:hypothetical protein
MAAYFALGDKICMIRVYFIIEPNVRSNLDCIAGLMIMVSVEVVMQLRKNSFQSEESRPDGWF